MVLPRVRGWKWSENRRTRWQLTSLSFTRVASLFTFLYFVSVRPSVRPSIRSVVRVPCCLLAGLRPRLGNGLFFFVIYFPHRENSVCFSVWFRFNHLWSAFLSLDPKDVRRRCFWMVGFFFFVCNSLCS